MVAAEQALAAGDLSSWRPVETGADGLLPFDLAPEYVPARRTG